MDPNTKKKQIGTYIHQENMTYVDNLGCVWIYKNIFL